ncbi:MAG: cellulase family glycosylhydrolase [Candidatus Marinimicrobia bacterium]|nr:cellulase family glycosylhydrolase [Candidatus Neomarinimicrobiota bacterium]
MKKYLVFVILATTLMAEIPFNRGINLTQWFEINDIRKISFSKYTKEDFVNIKSLGCDVIRLPMRMNDFSDGAPDYTLDPLFFFFLDQVVDWTEEVGINLILDNHTFSSDVDTDKETTDPLIPVWQQMAARYEPRSSRIFYEILNEPHNCDDSLWYEIQGHVIDAIRAIDTKHTIIVGGANWNSYQDLVNMPLYEDDNLIYTFHFYDPFIFTHQGATWGDPSLENLAGVPFPYVAFRMPSLPADLAGTWVESSLNNYNNDGTIGKVRALIDIAAEFQAEKGHQTYCGELGVLQYNAADEDRNLWYRIVSEYLTEKSIPWTLWDYQGGFGLFEKGTFEQFEYDLNIPLIEALGFNVPQQKEYHLYPDSAGFLIYSDFIEKNLRIDHWSYDIENVNLFYNTNVRSGSYCLQWRDQAQYKSIVMDFFPDKDLSYLTSQDYYLDFYVKSNLAGLKFDVRFVDTITEDEEDHPWRMRTTIDQNLVSWNDEWQHVQIALAGFAEHGSWHNNTWHDPVGLFDWKTINYFEIALEHMDITGHEVFFDDIKIIRKQGTLAAEFSVDVTAGQPPLTVYFTDQSTGDIATWAWNFGDGDVSNEQNPSHTYQTSGDFSVTLTISDNHGNDSITKNNYISVDFEKPEADFSADITTGTAPLTIHFSNHTQGEVTTWRWNFGDGTTSDEAAPDHLYSEAGSFTVSLTATGPGGRDTKVINDYITLTGETAICEDLGPQNYQLFSNYPNPFNPVTKIRYTLPEKCHVSLSVYTSRGEIIAQLVDAVENPGNHAITWNASELPSGIYIYKLVTHNFSDVKTCLLLK